MRKYQYKVYDKTKATLKSTINPEIIINEIRFTEIINGWQWQLVVKLSLPLTDTTFLQWDILEVSVFDDDSDTWTVLYTGFIEEINKLATERDEIELRVNGIFSFFSRILYEESSNYTLTKSWDPKTIIDAMVDFFNTKYNLLTKNTDTFWTSVSYDFDYTSIFTWMKDIIDLAENYFWYLWSDYEVKFKPLPSTTRNIFTYERDIISLDIDEDALNIVNQLHLEYKTWTKTYSDATSISTYWLREKYITNTKIANVTSADEFWAKYISDFKDPKKKIVMEINAEYAYQRFLLVDDLTDQVNDYTQTIDNLFETVDIESVQPGECCKINNIEFTLPSNLLISKKEYTPDKIKLYLERFENFIWLIKE